MQEAIEFLKQEVVHIELQIEELKAKLEEYSKAILKLEGIKPKRKYTSISPVILEYLGNLTAPVTVEELYAIIDPSLGIKEERLRVALNKLAFRGDIERKDKKFSAKKLPV